MNALTFSSRAGIRRWEDVFFIIQRSLQFVILPIKQTTDNGNSWLSSQSAYSYTNSSFFIYSPLTTLNLNIFTFQTRAIWLFHHTDVVNVVFCVIWPPEKIWISPPIVCNMLTHSERASNTWFEYSSVSLLEPKMNVRDIIYFLWWYMFSFCFKGLKHRMMAMKIWNLIFVWCIILSETLVDYNTTKRAKTQNRFLHIHALDFLLI